MHIRNYKVNQILYFDTDDLYLPLTDNVYEVETTDSTAGPGSHIGLSTTNLAFASLKPTTLSLSHY